MTRTGEDRLAGIILAGGRSRRMGQDKAAMEWDGAPMLSRIAWAISARCEPVLVAAPRTSQAYLELSDETDLDWVTTEKAGSGPLGGLVAALQAAADAGAEAAFVCATDMPLVDTGLIDELLDGLTESTDVVVAHEGGRDHPMAGVYRTRSAQQLADLVEKGELRMGAALDALVTRRIGVSDPDWLTNVDAPEDLHRLRSSRAS
ncbi:MULTISPECIES: molybdenum cofactor guanylyltransferase [Gordonia]|uniref:Probable molybdenum cofactor guanylyltransferase n=2 Tax=Gordonia TaxID=2053 RepID=L7LMA6_9ACTN|nr:MULTISPECIES: molybdenum cofactor guanylyltransferase [Gordonia]AUH69343.1 molybdenum cofactor guanylyltransferase [Gordonia sp. YC-JH1]KJR09799.1 molybdopterin guanine dinucleotide synthase [Gordonia sihwensis]KXT56637.1 molybdopterin guanine dinucleotide synthase [Gordonia sp. QH-12]WFN94344.1 molybdenum cofactor guanylyltransferase [Gordonia sihwensis]GAC61237.1 putative molybdenum cofactor guanylyltransferase [Gordonia sihwensis NBRC 108236]